MSQRDPSERWIDEFMVRVFTEPLSAPLQGPPEERLKAVSEALAKTMTEHPALRAYLRLSFLENDLASSKVFNRFAMLLRDLQYEMRGAGLLRDDLDLEWTPLQVMFLHFGPLLLGPAVEQIMSVDAYAQDVVRRRSQATRDLLSNGILRNPAITERGQQ